MKRVLSVGQCGVDHRSISHLIESRFQAEVSPAHGLDEALAQLRGGGFDLVLVNRRLDADGSDGLEVIRQIKADGTLAALPVLLVSNYADAQQAAVAAGAEMGFGKAELAAAETRERLARFL